MTLKLASDVLAVGALGTAATGLVDTTKVFGAFGTSRVGFGFIQKTMQRLVPADSETQGSGLGLSDILDTLLANWINGMDSASQEAAATSFVKLHLNEQSAESLARATGVAIKLKQAGALDSALTAAETDAFGRFDLSVAALVGRAYQQGDQLYRNVCKGLACVVAVALALIANYETASSTSTAALALPWWQAILLGLIATPLAPIAKDIANAIQTASDTINKIKG
jgi:hypothetical protein